MIQKAILLLCLLLSGQLLSQTANDCTFAIPVCGNSNFGLEPDGVGFNEFSIPENIVPPCHNFNNNTIWFIISVEQSGTLAFDIIPDNKNADYDFAIYGPDGDCTSLGASIRCSSTNPQAAGVTALTGLNTSETDFFEGPGLDGNGYLQAIDAQAGDVYYMVVDRAIGDEGFSINMTGSAGFPEQPVANPVSNSTVCEEDLNIDGFTTFDFSSLIPSIIQGQTNVVVSFHSSLNDANLNSNALPLDYTNTANPQTIYYRVTNINSGCSDIGNFIIEVDPTFSITLPQDLLICTNLNNAITLQTQSGYSFYRWSTGEEGANLNSITVTEGGTYSVIATDSNGCNALAETVVASSTAPTIVDVITQNFSQENNTIEIIATGDATLEYALDNDVFSENNIFENLSPGVYTVFVRDSLGCGTSTETVFIVDYPQFFTPNEDGYHDVWVIDNIENFPNTKIRIYNRFGVLIQDVIPTIGWDGRNKYGKPLPSNDYWFTLELESGRKLRGHFTLKR